MKETEEINEKDILIIISKNAIFAVKNLKEQNIKN